MTTAHELHPIIRPPEGYEPVSPVRDETQLGADEDLDRENDGVPHGIVGLTALFSVMLALLVGMLIVSGGWARVAGVILPILAIPVLVTTLHRSAARRRDHMHPSR